MNTLLLEDTAVIQKQVKGRLFFLQEVLRDTTELPTNYEDLVVLKDKLEIDYQSLKEQIINTLQRDKKLPKEYNALHIVNILDCWGAYCIPDDGIENLEDILCIAFQSYITYRNYIF